MSRFQGQTKLHGSKPSDFHLAIEEAVMAENGYVDSAMEAGQETSPAVNQGEAEEATGSNQESGCTIQQASNVISELFWEEYAEPCLMMGYIVFLSCQLPLTIRKRLELLSSVTMGYQS